MARFLTGSEPPDPNDRFRTWSGCAPGISDEQIDWLPGQVIPVQDPLDEPTRWALIRDALKDVELWREGFYRYFWCKRCHGIMNVRQEYGFLDDLVFCQECHENPTPS